MTSSISKLSDDPNPSYYHPIPTDPPPPPPPPQYVLVLPYAPTQPSTYTLICNALRRWFLCLSFLLLLTSAAYLLYPSDPEISVVCLHLDRLQFHTLPKLSLDVTLDVTVKLQNKDFYSLDYNYLLVAISYRGKQLGFATSDHGHVQARGSSYINATLRLDAVEIFADVIPLIEDLAKGSITFDTVTEVSGQLGLLFLEIPLQAKVACEIIVDTQNQTISRQNCYPE